VTTLASGFASVLGVLGSFLLRLRDRVQPADHVSNDAQARAKFKEAVAAIRRANAGKSEDEVRHDVEGAIHEVREARRAAGGR
jgi:hypothetical protein